MEIDFKLDEIGLAAKQFLSYTSAYKIFTFTGEMGAGKTTFIDALCRGLGVREKATSPTYSLINEYETWDKQIIYHMDFYRLDNIYEAVDAGIEECISSGEYCMIEWPAKIQSLLPVETVDSRIIVFNDHLRKMVVQLP